MCVQSYAKTATPGKGSWLIKSGYNDADATSVVSSFSQGKNSAVINLKNKIHHNKNHLSYPLGQDKHHLYERKLETRQESPKQWFAQFLEVTKITDTIT
jgi:hypothetical protein